MAKQAKEKGMTDFIKDAKEKENRELLGEFYDTLYECNVWKKKPKHPTIPHFNKTVQEFFEKHKYHLMDKDWEDLYRIRKEVADSWCPGRY